MDKIKFLEYVYSRQCSPGDSIFLASLSLERRWSEYQIKYKKSTIRRELEKFFRVYPQEKFNLYFSPMSYKGNKRLRDNGNTTKFLSQDIDENYQQQEPRPSIIWESSPGKYQGLWELDREISVSEFESLNKALATKIGADDCYDYPHVFRIPGTVNHKYKAKPIVSKAKVGKPVKLYRPNNLKKILDVKKLSQSSKKSNESAKNSNDSLQERKIYAKYNIPQDIRDYLASPELQEDWDRSKIIWYIENKLNEMGMSPTEIITLVKGSVFNKYKGRHDEEKRLKAELMKIISNQIVEEDDVNVKPLKFSTYQDVMGSLRTFEGWLIKGIWGRRSHGIVAGMPKTFKSTLVQDFAVSVASGEPFLGKYPVLESGPVIIIQNENADYIMKDRTEKMITSKGLVGKVDVISDDELKVKWAPDLPICFVNQEGFTLSDEKKKKSLEKLIEEVKPILVIFDPLYLMFDGDINKAEDLNPALNWLLQLKNNHKTSVMLLHHYNKGGSNSDEKGGARMSGSIFLYGWIESAWYLTKEEGDYTSDSEDDEEEFKPMKSTVELRREFRMASQYPDLNITLDMGEIGDPHYHVDVEIARDEGQQINPQVKVKDDSVRIEELLSDGSVYNKRIIGKKLKLDRATVRRVLGKMFKDGKVELVDGNLYKLSEV